MKAELLSYFGNDLMVANVARVSYDKESLEGSTKDARLIKFLADHKHTSPFRHPQLQFRIQCPIFVERQLFTHQIGWARNSISGRYVDFSDSYWLPDKLRFQSKDSKQGSAEDIPEDKNEYFLSRMMSVIEHAQEVYKEMSDFGIAKEQCRIHLPLALETKFIWTGSFQAFVHLCNLRLKPDAQKETRDTVSEMLSLVQKIEGRPFQYCLEAFGLHESNI
jgi:thymidylate synthase (FAD)